MVNLIGKQAPDFTADTVMANNEIRANFNLKEYTEGSYGVLFFYPLDFTFVCPSEIIAFDRRLKDFESRGAKVIAVSVDSQFTHVAYKNTPIKEGGIGQVQFPMVADLSKNIARDYGVLQDGKVALRGTFIFDKEGVVRHQLINDLPLGRNVDETLRTLDALIYHEQHGEVCPANWQQGKAAMTPSTEGVTDYLRKFASGE
jgi:peroxiredoxin (alkyl hydroperoxide reductase subunit C)